jgi:hypothetical protein
VRRADRWEGNIEATVEGETWTQKNNDQRAAAKKKLTVMQCGLRQGKNQMRKRSPSHGRDRQLDQIRISYAPIGLIPPFNRAGLFLPVCVSTFSNKVAICSSDRFSYVSVCSDKRISKPIKRRVPGFIHPSRLSLVRLFSRRLWSLALVAFLPSPIVLALVSSICTQLFYRLSMCVLK